MAGTHQPDIPADLNEQFAQEMKKKGKEKSEVWERALISSKKKKKREEEERDSMPRALFPHPSAPHARGAKGSEF